MRRGRAPKKRTATTASAGSDTTAAAAAAAAAADQQGYFHPYALRLALSWDSLGKQADDS